MTIKITHRQNDNYTYSKYGSVIRGDIIVSQEVFKQFKAYLKKQHNRKDTYYFHNIVMERLNQPYGTKNNCYSLGVTPNKLLAEKFDFKLPKQINYQIIVK